MWRPIFAALVAAALAGLAGSARADLDEGFTHGDFALRSAQDLLDLCTLDDGHPDHETARAFCFGFIRGGKHYHDAVTVGPDRHPIVCPAEDATLVQAVDLFVAYAQANPGQLSEPPMEVVFRAATAEWPCDRQARR